VVLHSRRGIPVSLAVLWLELARGWLSAGVSVFPGISWSKVNLPHGQAVNDPLTGQSVSRRS